MKHLSQAEFGGVVERQMDRRVDLHDEGVAAARKGRRVLLAAATRLYRDGLAASLNAQHGITVVETVATAHGCLERAPELRPDVVLFDGGIEEGFAVVAALRHLLPEAIVVVLGLDEVNDDFVAWAEVGVAAYVDREGSVADLLTAMETALTGGAVCSSLVAGALVRRVHDLASSRPAASRSDGACLTERERDVATLLTRGLTNKDIATALGIRLPTVKNHVHNILEKLGVTSRGQAAACLRALVPS